MTDGISTDVKQCSVFSMLFNVLPMKYDKVCKYYFCYIRITLDKLNDNYYV